MLNIKNNHSNIYIYTMDDITQYTGYIHQNSYNLGLCILKILNKVLAIVCTHANQKI
jgi:hypothetical protein